ncbi:putative protein ABIL2 isoform X2 [Oryza brachyantha]|uniref:Protein ABIL3 n=1 Tax=Oryza brachyantha TaxID=4533 RepID=J3L0Z5_ORYBR|nr:putative protein ABIL2 isoform X2 [Oryza brachyantha]
MVEAVGSFRRGGVGISGMSSSTLEEVQMQETLIFSDTIKDLKMLKSQLYSAAEYFELAYTQEEDKQEVMSNLKEYSVKALVNTVDHLGSISFKVSTLLDQRFDEVEDTNLRASCIQQRAQASQACMDKEGLSQQSLVITAPKYHKRYILPAGDGSMPHAVPNFSEMRKAKSRAAQMQQVFSAAAASQAKAKEKQPSFSKLRSIARAPSQRARSSSPAQRPRSTPPPDNTMPTKRADKRSESPLPATSPLKRSGSLPKRPSLLKTSSVRVQMQTTSEHKKLASVRSHADRCDDSKEGEHTPKKGKKFLKSLLSRRKSRKEEPLPCYFDDY